MEFKHITVLKNEMIRGILTNPSGIYVDCTLGGGGHSLALAEHLQEDALLIGIDQDEAAVEAAKTAFAALHCRYQIIRSNFSDIQDVLKTMGIRRVSGFMFDLGVSSYQLDQGMRGFSYMHDGTLDMRMDQRNPITAETIVNTYSEQRLSRIISEYGEERWASRIAKFICDHRKLSRIKTTGELVSIIKAAIPAGARREGPHPAKRTFQALRIEVNQELSRLEKAISDCIDCLEGGGRIGVISFQSLEDRIVKKTFRDLERDCICPPDMPICTCGGNHKKIRVIGKAIKPSAKEIEINPRARSAILRVAERV